MAEKKPLVLGNGVVNQISSADTLLVPGNSKFKGNKLLGQWRYSSGFDSNATYLQAEQGESYSEATTIPIIPPDGGYITRLKLCTDADPVSATSLTIEHASGDFAYFSVDTNDASYEPVGFSFQADGEPLFEIYHPNVYGGAYIYSGLYVQDFTRLGESSPAIKIKKLTGTTGATAGSSVVVATGVPDSKVIGIQVFVSDAGNTLILPGMRYYSGRSFDAVLGGGYLSVLLSATDSASLISRPFTALITYEE